jgi:hypothetical protein
MLRRRVKVAAGTMAFLGAMGLLFGRGAAPPVHTAQQAAAWPDGWLKDYEEGRRLARETGKPLFVVFRCEP